MDYSGNGYTGTLAGPERIVTVGTNKAMYYDATGSDYIQTSSFAIPNTGVLTIESWMNSKLNATKRQSPIGDGAYSTTIGFLWMERVESSDTLRY